MKRKLFALLPPLLLTLCFAVPAWGAAEKPPVVRVGLIKGPSGMGGAFLMSEEGAARAQNVYAFTLSASPELLLPQLLTGALDMAALPTNTIAALAAKSNGAVQLLAINTLCTLSLLEKGETVTDIGDLQGKTIVCAGQGTTVEVIASLLFEGAEIRYVSEHAEAVALALQGRADWVLLPEPFASALLGQAPAFRVAFDLNAVWQEKGYGALPMGGIAVRRAFAQAHPEAVAAFLTDYAFSVAYANAHPREAGMLTERVGILAAGVAESAIPRLGLTCVTGEAMRQMAAAYYARILFANPALLGGTMPADVFYVLSP